MSAFDVEAIQALQAVVAAAKAPSLISIPAKASFTRPSDTTAYAVGDLIANSTTAGSVAPLSWPGATIAGAGGSGSVFGVMVGKSAATQALVRVHFFKAAPAVTNGDNGAISVTSFDLDNYVGFADVSLDSGVNGGAAGVAGNLGLDYVLASGDTLYALIEARSVFTPDSAGTWRVRPKFRRFS